MGRRVLAGVPEPSENPVAARIAEPVAEVLHPGDVDAASKELRIAGERLEREKPSIAQPPHTDPVDVHVEQALEVRHPRGPVLVVEASEIAVRRDAPLPAIADAPPVVRSENHV